MKRVLNFLNVIPMMILALAMMLIITFAAPAHAQGVGGGNDVIYAVGNGRYGINIVTGSAPTTTTWQQWLHWGGNGKRRTLNGGWCDVNGCSAP